MAMRSQCFINTSLEQVLDLQCAAEGCNGIERSHELRNHECSVSSDS